MPAVQPIATAPRNGKIVFVVRGSTIAKAFWHSRPGEDPAAGMWAYAVPEGCKLVHQVDFEPTGWVEDSPDFLESLAALTSPAT